MDYINPATNPYVISNLTAQTQYEVQVSTICGGTQGPFSASVNFTTASMSYCNSGTVAVTTGYISNVTMTGINTPVMSNNSGPSTYTDYSNDPAKTITLARNTTGNVLSVGRTFTSTDTYSTYAWIDFNGDGIFNNNPSTTAGGERVMALSYSTTSPVTATFAVPANAYVGANKLKMRVIVYYLTPTDACSPLTSTTGGEVEDYTVRFIDIQPCTTAAPTGITINNLTATTANVSWIASTGATYYVRWRTTSPVGTWITSPVVTGNSYNITGLSEQTAYEVQVSTVCGGTQGAWSASTPFTTTPITYCNMIGTGTNDHISNVTITPSNPGIPVMTNTSAQTNYISYATPVITLEIGSSNNKISVSKGWTAATNSDAVSAWIDFNRNGTFEASEQIFASPANTTTPVTGTFSVPATVYTGPLTTTMRVVLKRTSAPVMCQNAANGEVEDYAVKFVPCSTATPGAPTIAATHNSATVTWTGATNNITYLVRYRLQGPPAGAWTEVYASTMLGNVPLTITNLTPATAYEIQIAAVCGTTAGTFTAIKAFTTRCDPTPPNVTVSNVNTNSALITWAPLAASSTYVLRWRQVGGTWVTVNLPNPPANTFTLGGLNPYTTYEVQVANICNGETTPNPWSTVQVFTTERTCEIPPPGLTITTLTPTSAVVTWDPFPGATYILRYRKVGIPSWTNIPVATNTYTLTNLMEMTKYEMQVANVCSGNTTGNYTPLYYFTTPTVMYCKMSSASSSNEFISKVTVKPNGKPTMENASGASNYTDYTANPKTFIELIQGSTGNEISIEKSWVGGNHDEGVAVWIDFDRNGYFDINERVFASAPNTTTPVKGTFNVPADAFVSMTDYKYVVMRVAMQRDGIPVNCSSFQNGEVEDYTVRISKLPVPNAANQDDILIYPNPVSTVLYVKNISKKGNFKIYNAAGQLISNGLILNNQINVSKLINGVYVIEIEDAKGSIQKKFIKE